MLNFNDPVAQKDGTIKPLFEGSGGGGGSEYSTEEKIIGKWIDGSALYQKTIELDNVVLSDSEWTNLFNINMNVLVDYSNTYLSNNGYVATPYVRVRYYDGVLYGAISKSQNIIHLYITLKYTK